ncbi:MAG: methyltransferase [Alphaproteobacteria bacterium]|nr:methyltransferase [Alphaproteobacteria bacterium]
MAPQDLTCDRWYDGSLTLRQPARGFRATTDAILLAAAIPLDVQHPLELGAGAGAVTIALAARLPKLPITAIERDPDMAALLARNAEDNGFSDRITIITSDALLAKAPWHGRHDLVLANPPYNDISSSLSANDHRKASMAAADLGAWVMASAGALAPKGRMVMISRADRLDEVLAALPPIFGDVSLRAIHSLPDAPASRVLITARKGISGALTMLPPLILRKDAENLTAEMDAISHHRAAIDLLPPGRNFGKVRLPY